MSVGQWLLSVHWLVPVVIYIVFAFGAVRWLGKHLANLPNQAKRLTINFGFCAIIATTLAIATGNVRFDHSTYLLCVIGVFNAIANVAHWQANRVSMSKTSLFSFGDDIIAMLLSMLVIGDGMYLNGTSGTGLMFCVAAGILFWWHSWRGGESTAFYKSVMIYCVLWGICIFANRYFAMNKLPITQFIAVWYGSTFLTIGAYFLYRHYRHPYRIALWRAFIMPTTQVLWISLFAVGIMISLALQFWAFTVAPQTIVQPPLLVAEAIVPALVGVVLFKEGKMFDTKEKIYGCLAVLGVVLLAIGYNNH